MNWALLLTLAFLGLIVFLTCTAVLMVRGRLNRRHRVDPRVRTEAPLRWLVDPRSPARLHRRLARVGTAASTVADDHRPPTRRFRKVEPTPMMSTAADVRAQAVALDQQLARLALLSANARKRPLADLSRSVTEVETATARLVALSAELRTHRGLPTDPQLLADQPTLTAIAEQMDRLARAHDELAQLDRDAGLATAPYPAAATTRWTPGEGTQAHG